MTDDDLNYTHDDIPYLDLEPANEYSVLTVIPGGEEPEYREYLPNGEELPRLIQDIRDPRVAEMILQVDPHY